VSSASKGLQYLQQTNMPSSSSSTTTKLLVVVLEVVVAF